MYTDPSKYPTHPKTIQEDFLRDVLESSFFWLLDYREDLSEIEGSMCTRQLSVYPSDTLNQVLKEDLETPILTWMKNVAIRSDGLPDFGSGYAVMSGHTFSKYYLTEDFKQNGFDQMVKGNPASIRGTEICLLPDRAVELGTVLLCPNPERVARVLFGFSIDDRSVTTKLRIEPVDCPQVKVYTLTP